MLFDKNATILFQGDSITDAEKFRDGEGLGFGYARMCIRTLEALYPDYALTCHNRGISGNRVVDLEARWQEDCEALRPDLTSIYIGINDTWHHYGTGFCGGVSHEAFEKSYRNILERTRKLGSKIIMVEPYAFHHDAFKEEYRVDLMPKIQIIRALAREYADAYLPLDGIMNAAAVTYGAEALSADGVHPTPLGHRIIAKNWLRVVGALD